MNNGKQHPWWSLERDATSDDAHAWAVKHERNLRREQWKHRPPSFVEALQRFTEAVGGTAG